MSVRLAINGFGRIGRCIYRIACDHPDLEVVAVNDLTDAKNLAYLLKYDSVHRTFRRDVQARDGALVVDGRETKVLATKEPSELPWKALGVDVVLECTGKFKMRADAAKHLAAGARKVVISAPADDPDLTIVLGVNEDRYDAAKHHVLSNASCTTNCLAPAVKVLHQRFGIERALMTTVHSMTNDQSLLDLPHKKDWRRGRAATMSMVPTTTGAAKAVELVLPELEGRLDGVSVRVPTPDVSLADLVAVTEKPASLEAVLAALREAADGKLKGILRVSDEELVSVDLTGETCSAVVDAPFAMTLGDRMVKLLLWYDNEWGFSTRMVELCRRIAA